MIKNCIRLASGDAILSGIEKLLAFAEEIFIIHRFSTDHTTQNKTDIALTISARFTVEDQAWVATQASVGMGVTVGQRAVVGAHNAVFKNVGS